MPVKGYRLTLDYRRYVPLLPPRDQAGIRKTLDRLERLLGTTKLPVEVWIASDGTIRRVKGELKAHGSGITYSMNLSPAGKAQRMRPPPPATVVDARKL
jgi:hypothetical protein